MGLNPGIMQEFPTNVNKKFFKSLSNLFFLQMNKKGPLSGSNPERGPEQLS